MMLYAVAIVLVHAVLVVQGNLFTKTQPADDIETMCANKPIALFTVPELQHLNTIVGSSSCSSNVKAAIPDLVTLIEQTRNNLCAQESIDKLREFYAKYLDTSKENKNREELPESLRKFALAYGMQMSSACKGRMVWILITKGQDKLYTKTHRAIRGLVSDTSPVADMLEGLAGPDEILLPGDLAPFIKPKNADGAKKKEDDDDDDDTMYVQSATGPYIRKMQENCNKVFAPIYKPLISSITQLANMGFNYKDEPLRCEMGCSNTSNQLAKWSRLVFLCESLSNMYVVGVPDSSDKLSDHDNNQKTVRLLTKQEAAAIEGDQFAELEPVVENTYDRVGLQNELIYNKDDKQLKKAIKKFSTSKSEDEKVLKRMMVKGKDLFNIQRKRHGLFFMMSSGYKALAHRIRTGENLKPTDEIVRVLDGAIGHESQYLDVPKKSFDEKWEDAKDIASVIGIALAAALMGILVLAFFGMIIALIVLKCILIAHVAG